MKTKWLVSFLLALSLITGLLGCHNKAPANTTPTEFPTTNEISISIKDDSVSADGLTLILTNASSEYRFVYSDGAGIEKLSDGEWIDLYEGKGQETALVAHSVAAGCCQEHEVCWKEALGSLHSGEYRIVMYVDKRPAENWATSKSLGTYVLYANFQL